MLQNKQPAKQNKKLKFQILASAFVSNCKALDRDNIAKNAFKQLKASYKLK